MNNNIEIKLIKYHANGAVGYWNLNEWIANGKFPLSVVFPGEYGNSAPESLELRINSCSLAFSMRLNGSEISLPEFCKSLLSYSEEDADKLLGMLIMCMSRSGEYTKLWESPESTWYEVLNSWRKKYRVFSAENWEELFEHSQDRYAYVFEHLPASIHINEDTREYLNIDAIRESVAERFSLFEGEYFIIGAIKEETDERV